MGGDPSHSRSGPSDVAGLSALPGLGGLDPSDMASGAAERGPHGKRHPEVSAPRLAQGYRLRSMSELKDQEFGRLAGEGRRRGHPGL